MRHSAFVILAVVLGLGCNSKGTCIIKNNGVENCWVNYRKAACDDEKAEFHAGDGQAGVAVCTSQGYTQPKKAGGWPMSDAELKAALEKGDTVVFDKPSAR